MGVEENIASFEELMAVDPFAEPAPSAESVFGFPAIQTEADNTHVFDHSDAGTVSAVNEMHANLDEHYTYKADLSNDEYTSQVDESTKWEKRLERLAARRVDPITNQGETHDFISEAEQEDNEQALEFQDDDTATEPIDAELIHELDNIQHQLKSIGGVSRNEIIALEALLGTPGVFGNPRGFSAIHSRTGYTATMEALGSKIKTLVKELIDQLIEGCKTLLRYVIKTLGFAFMSQHMHVSLIARRQELLAKAKRMDAVYGLEAYKGLTSATDIPPYKEATSTENFVIRYLDYRIKQRFQQRFTIGLRMIIENSGLSGHVKQVRGEIDRALNQVDSFVTLLNKNEPADWGKLDTQFNMSGLNSLLNFWNVRGQTNPSDAIADYRAAVNFAFRQEDTGGRRPVEFVKVANYTNPFSDNPNFQRTVGSTSDRITRSLRELDRKVSRMDDQSRQQVATGKLMEVQRRLNVVRSLFSIYTSFAKYYESFYQMLAQPILTLNRQIDFYNKAQVVKGIVSDESFASMEDLLLGPELFDDMMRSQGWRPDAEKANDPNAKVTNRTLACAQQINAEGMDSLQAVFKKVLMNRWLFKGDYEDNDDITYLRNAGLIYQPKVIDLEGETPDWGVTDFGRGVGQLLYGNIDELKPDPKIRAILDLIWDDERLGARELLRAHAVDGNRGIHQPAVQAPVDIEFLQQHDLVSETSKLNHSVHDADEGSWFVTSLGMEIAKHF